MRLSRVIYRSRSQKQFPCFPNKLMTETVMDFLGHKLKSCFLVDVSRFQENAIGPEHQFGVSMASSEADTLFDEVGAQPQTACPRLNQQKSKFGDGFATLHYKYRANNFTIHLCNPAAFSFRVIVVNKICDDLSNKCLELFVPA